ncbi:uncharacterized protein (DUF58 family) [Methanomicrobium sp. W14]|uniref:DUF58 domain-containing protein n=1 Tax=Methanomicrobium sp. W14 TaxID=2817839 RepID=UPI001AEA2C3C|nr:DUF58 domain-containing protein [Methanomicrobium sp. W14]MBP2132783.1 uncharacterized protein (DUF58 family) [Methanomicrobium sp. W14]
MLQDKKDLIKKIGRVDISTRALVEGLQSGYYISVFKGHGIEFTDIREYVPGDDVRAIDWNVTARQNRPFVREFIEERDQTFYFVLDYSGSGFFGSDNSKFEKMLEIAASLMFAAVRSNDRIGLCIFTDKVERFVPAKKGRTHVISLINEMIVHKPADTGTDVSAAFEYLSRRVSKRSSFVVISDFMSPDFEKSLKILKSRHHEVIAVKISDIRETELLDVGLVEFEDPETGEQILIDTSDAQLRENYTRLCRQADESVVSKLRKGRAGVISIDNTESFVKPLNIFFNGKIKGGGF